MSFDIAVTKLKQALVDLRNDVNAFQEIKQNRESVFNRYQQMFSKENINNLNEVDFKSFLILENNKHWSGLQRLGPQICSDMGKLRNELLFLLDENENIEQRLDRVVNNVKGMGKAIITAILLVTFPEKYGVWNNTSEGALKVLNIWPKFDRNESFGKRYIKVNNILLKLLEKLETDFWTLDMLWWSMSTTDNGNDTSTDEQHTSEQRFGLEKYLHEFLRDNWNNLTLGNEWVIYSEPGDNEAGFEYPCHVGRIDILAHHKTEARWLVIELKRNQSSDKTVGQILRYIGWVQTNLADQNEIVEGLIIAHQADDLIRYALMPISNVKLQLYEVEFKLQNP